MARPVGTRQVFRIPVNRETKKPYAFAGKIHWSELIDTPIRQYVSIFSVPLVELGEEVQMEDGIEVPLCQNSNNQEYWLVKFDPDYLKERFYREWVQALRWTPKTVENFFQINQRWINERIAFFQKAELMEQAVQLSERDPKHRDAEFWYNELLKLQQEDDPEEEEKKVETSIPDDSLKGVLEKLSNEYFITTVEKHRYKVKPEQLLSSTIPSGTVNDLIGCNFKFKADTSNPPKSRQAKGWVTTLTYLG